MLTYEIGEKVYLKVDPDDIDIVEGMIVEVYSAMQEAYVKYEVDGRVRYREVSFEELEYCMDVMLETASWF